MTTQQAIPDQFVWTKMQTNAGESLENIIRRKELERKVGNGIFWWGVGESKGPAIKKLIGICSKPEILFS